jgi:hypothetical protein
MDKYIIAHEKTKFWEICDCYGSVTDLALWLAEFERLERSGIIYMDHTDFMVMQFKDFYPSLNIRPIKK